MFDKGFSVKNCFVVFSCIFSFSLQMQAQEDVYARLDVLTRMATLCRSATGKAAVSHSDEVMQELKAALLNEPMPTRYETPKTTPVYTQNINVPKKQIEVFKVSEPQIAYNPQTNGKQYFVQAGAFSKSESANSLSKKLTQFGNVKIAEADVNGKRFYRVRLGPYSFEEEAKVALAKVKNYGIQNASVVRD